MFLLDFVYKKKWHFLAEEITPISEFVHDFKLQVKKNPKENGLSNEWN